MGLGIRDRDWSLEMGIGIRIRMGNWDLGFKIGDFGSQLEIWIGNGVCDCDWVFGLRFGIWDWD